MWWAAVVGAVLGVSMAMATVQAAPDMSSFGSLDRNDDGKISLTEVQTTSLPSCLKDLLYKSLSDNDIDEDQDDRLSELEWYNMLAQRLGRLVAVGEVAEWVTYAVQKPQFANLFRQNYVSGHDFVDLVKDGGQLLVDEIGIDNRSARNHMRRQMIMKLCSDGPPPARPAAPVLVSSSTAVVVRWEEPLSEAAPIVCYQLQRADDSGVFRDINVLAPLTDTMFHDAVPNANKPYLYRVQAWSVLGRSGWSPVSTSEPPGLGWESLVVPALVAVPVLVFVLGTRCAGPARGAPPLPAPVPHRASKESVRSRESSVASSEGGGGTTLRFRRTRNAAGVGREEDGGNGNGVGGNGQEVGPRDKAVVAQDPNRGPVGLGALIQVPNAVGGGPEAASGGGGGGGGGGDGGDDDGSGGGDLRSASRESLLALSQRSSPVGILEGASVFSNDDASNRPSPPPPPMPPMPSTPSTPSTAPGSEEGYFALPRGLVSGRSNVVPRSVTPPSLSFPDHPSGPQGLARASSFRSLPLMRSHSGAREERRRRPKPPTNVRVVAGDKELRVEWEPPKLRRCAHPAAAAFALSGPQTTSPQHPQSQPQASQRQQQQQQQPEGRPPRPPPLQLVPDARLKPSRNLTHYTILCAQDSVGARSCCVKPDTSVYVVRGLINGLRCSVRVAAHFEDGSQFASDATEAMPLPDQRLNSAHHCNWCRSRSGFRSHVCRLCGASFCSAHGRTGRCLSPVTPCLGCVCKYCIVAGRDRGLPER